MSSFAEEEKEEKKAVKQQKTETVKETVQRDLSDVNGPKGGMLPDSVSSKIQSMRGSGQKLSERNLQNYSQKFGRDMSDVHVHTDAESDTISRSLNARAFTIGSDIFLSRGINPDGGGHDAETMTHELTHVVQQGGRASSGPLKLGAADTAQEHEAEATAMREYAPEMKEEGDTIQRGFLGALGSTIGHNLLGMVGLEDAYNATYGAKHKVQEAVSQLDAGKLEEFEKHESEINNYQEQLELVQFNLKNDDGSGTDSLMDEYQSISAELAELRKKQLTTLQEVDDSITDADMIQYRNKNSGKSMMMGALGSSILSGFSKDSNKDKASSQGMLAGVNYGAGSNAYTAAPEKKPNSANPEIKALQLEIANLKQQLASIKGPAQ